MTEIPVAGPEHLIRGKKVARPDMLEAISKHQSRMLRAQATHVDADVVHGVVVTQSLTGHTPGGSGFTNSGEVTQHGGGGVESDQLPSVSDGHPGEMRQVSASLLGGAAQDPSGGEGHHGRAGVDHGSVPGESEGSLP